MNQLRRNLLLAAASLAFATAAHAKDPKELVIGTSSGPYSDQLKLGIKPILEKQGYKVKIVEFNDYVQPNYALAEGSLDANVFQHIVYLTKFATDNKLPLSPLITVPTMPIGLYGGKQKTLAEVKNGATITMPNDPTNQARALVMLAKMGWIKLKPNVDPLRASERDVLENPKKLKLVPLEAAQLPRSLADADYAFVNGNFALAAGMKLTVGPRRGKDLGQLHQPGGHPHGRQGQAMGQGPGSGLPLARLPRRDEQIPGRLRKDGLPAGAGKDAEKINRCS